MIELKPEHHLYWRGAVNKAIRYLFYLNQGVDHGINRYRNLAILVFGVCITLKITSWKFMLLFSLVLLLVTGIFGYFFTHRMSKVMDFLTVNFGTYQGKRSLELQEETLAALNKINGAK